MERKMVEMKPWNKIQFMLKLLCGPLFYLLQQPNKYHSNELRTIDGKSLMWCFVQDNRAHVIELKVKQPKIRHVKFCCFVGSKWQVNAFSLNAKCQSSVEPHSLWLLLRFVHAKRKWTKIECGSVNTFGIKCALCDLNRFPFVLGL